MKSAFLPLILAILSVCFSSCAASPGGGTRSLAHSYYDPRGVTFISLFDLESGCGGTSMIVGRRESAKRLTVRPQDFETLWNQLDESSLAGYAVREGSREFDVRANYVVIKGWMPGHTTTYVVPKEKASPGLKNWVGSFRAKAGA